jgi:hypothetical protein
VTAGIDDGFGIVEDAEGEVSLAQVEPDALDGIELGTVGRQPDEGDVCGQAVGGQVVPAGAVEDDGGVDPVWQGLGEGVEELAKASKNRRVARVETSGSTRVKSSPVSGRTALKM